MKLSRRIEQFLLVLLEYEKSEVDKSMSPYRRSRRYQLEHFFYRRIHNLVPDEYGHFKASRTLRNSFNRTIRIMEKQDLILWIQDDYYDITLTEKGRKTATTLEEEKRKCIEDFSFLLTRKT